MRVYPIHSILSHEGLHKDEYAARMTAILFGQQVFPGIATAKLITTNAGQDTWRGMTGRQVLEKGILPLGVLADNPFNEHRTSTGERVKKACTATLMCKYLGVWDNNPAWQTVMNAVLADDAYGQKSPFDLSASLMRRYYFTPERFSETVRKADEEIILFYKYELSAMAVGRKYLDSNLFRWKKDVSKSGRLIRVGVVDCDDTAMLRFVTKYLEPQRRPDLFMQWQRRGTVQIHTNYSSKLCLDDMVAAIRQAEARKSGSQITNDAELLRAEGNIPGAPEWGYLMGENKMKKMVNGGPTAPTVQPTRLNEGELLRLIYDHIKPEPPKEEE